MKTDNIIKMLKKPGLFEQGTERIWTNSYIAGNMLKSHLSNEHDAASYRSSIRDEIVDVIISRTGIREGGRLIDFGCGPGLYVSRFAELGIQSTGVDFSYDSIEYAKRVNSDSQNCSFICQDYTSEIKLAEKFDAAIQVSQDFGVLSKRNRLNLLNNIRNSLKKNGWFFFDVPGSAAYDDKKIKNSRTWSIQKKGFYRPHDHLVIETEYFYDEEMVSCRSILVADDEIHIYRIWQTYFTIESITSELNDNGFDVLEITGGLDGRVLKDDSHVLGVVCRKKT